MHGCRVHNAFGCDDCRKRGAVEKTQRWRDLHPERYADSSRRADALRAADRRVERNSPEGRAASRGYAQTRRRAAPAAVRAAWNRWAGKNPAKIQDRNAQRRAASRSLLTVWVGILVAFRGRCAYCGSVEKMTMDHVLPLSRSGKHDPANIRPACRSCNSQKGSSQWEPRPWAAAIQGVDV